MKRLFIMSLLGLSITLSACSSNSTATVETKKTADVVGGSNAVVESESSDSNSDSKMIMYGDKEQKTDDTTTKESEDKKEFENKKEFEDKEKKTDDTATRDVKLDEGYINIPYDTSELNTLWDEYKDKRNEGVKLKDYKLNNICISYTGKEKIYTIDKECGNVLYISDGSDEVSIGVYDKSFNKDGWESVIEKGFKTEDSKGTVCYEAKHKDGGVKFYAYKDGTFVVVTYETGDLLSFIEFFEKGA